MLTKKTTKKIAIAWLVGTVLSGFGQTAGGVEFAAPIRMQATGPCAFSEQLQGSSLVRTQYANRLAKVLGTTATAMNSVEEMYSNIQPASYTEESATEATTDIWGFSLNDSTGTTTTTVAGVDPLSADCLGCHDGVGATAVSAVLRNDPFTTVHRPLSASDHPIGMDYNRYASAKSTDYKSVFGANSKMIFVDGKVGCLTCHDPLNPEKGHLVMSDARSALCLTCHKK